MKNVLRYRKNIIFGAGGTFIKYYYQELMGRNIEISYICDNDRKKKGLFIKGIEVISFEDLLEFVEKEEVNIIIASDYKKEIYEQLKEYGLEKFTYIDLIWDMCYLDELQELYNVEKFYSEAKEISGFLEENKSKEIYLDSFKYLLCMDRNLIINKEIEEEQYFLSEFLQDLNGKSIIDCGAYTGDTIEILLNLKIKPKKVIAFEVGKENYKKLAENIAKFKNIKFDLYNIGVWEKDIKLCLSGESGAGIQVNVEGEEFIECKAIDSIVKEKIDFIKMDIEGAELKALRGAKNRILEDRPILAICIYHSIKEMVEIPKYLMRNLKNYTFKVRRYSDRGAEVVIYCIPK